MAIEYTTLAHELARWLMARPGVAEVQESVAPRRQGGLLSRLPLPPPFGKPRQADFELRFTYKGQARRFRYFMEGPDDAQTVLGTLRVHTNGELMIRVPNEHGNLLPNDIYYDNRTATPGHGDPASSAPRHG